jgi:ABC-type phosphate transport system substrate-binding protein
MRRRSFLLLALLLAHTARAADTLLVIAHPGVATVSMSSDELSAIYLLQVTAWPSGDNIVPVNREASSSARALFSDTVLRQPPARLATYWNQMHFKGRAPPLVQSSDQAVLAFVQNVPGAIGYVSAAMQPKNVKILARIP